MKHYYDRSDLGKIQELIQLAPKASGSFLDFEKEVYQNSGAVSTKTKELIAIAVAHVTGCPYCIDVHVQRFHKLGGTKEEIMEAVLVAASTRAGAILSHATQALKSFENDKAASTLLSDPSAPKCFC